MELVIDLGDERWGHEYTPTLQDFTILAGLRPLCHAAKFCMSGRGESGHWRSIRDLRLAVQTVQRIMVRSDNSLAIVQFYYLISA
jgi:hypothetical protein